MSDPSPLREAVGSVERGLTPPLKQVLGSEQFAQVLTAANWVEGSVRRGITGVAGRMWHLVNLPSAADVQRVRTLVAELDQQVRELQRTVDRHEDGRPKP